MGVAQYLVQHHSKIAAVVLPLSVLGGFATTMMTGKSPFFMFRDAQGEEGKEAQQSMYTLNFKLGGIGSK